MKKIYKGCIGVLNRILGIFVVLSMAILLYGKFGPEADEASGKLIGTEEAGNAAEGAENATGAEEGAGAVVTVMTVEDESGGLAVEEMKSSTVTEMLSSATSMEAENVSDEPVVADAVPEGEATERKESPTAGSLYGASVSLQQALEIVQTHVNPYETFVPGNPDAQTINGKEFHVVRLEAGEGTFYVTKDTGDIYMYLEDGTFVPYASIFTSDFEPESTGTSLIGNLLYREGDCLILMGYEHMMYYHDVLNKVLRDAGIHQDIEDYKGTVYYTTTYNSTKGKNDLYDNIEIAPRISTYYFDGKEVSLNLKFDRTIAGGENGISREERYQARLVEVHLRFSYTEETAQTYINDMSLKEYFTSALGEPDLYFANEYRVSYRWECGNDYLIVSYMNRSENDAENKWLAAYVAVMHRQDN